MTVPGDCFSFGFTMDAFSLTTRNKDWQESFVKKSNKKIAINKLASIKDFGGYWNSKSKSFASLR